MSKRDNDHRFYKTRGRNVIPPRKPNGSRSKTKPGTRFSEPWICPDRECHSAAPGAILVGDPRK